MATILPVLIVKVHKVEVSLTYASLNGTQNGRCCVKEEIRKMAFRELIGQLKAKNISVIVQPVDGSGQGVRIETNWRGELSGRISGTEVGKTNLLAASDGTATFESYGRITTTDGHAITAKAGGVGSPPTANGSRFRGSADFRTSSGKYAWVNITPVEFEGEGNDIGFALTLWEGDRPADLGEKRQSQARQQRQSENSGQERRQPPPPPRDDQMTRSQALAILGLKEGATREQIHAAYVHLMKGVHPDTGGSNELARLLNEAREALLAAAR
jgi:hypothetical protein